MTKITSGRAQILSAAQAKAAQLGSPNFGELASSHLGQISAARELEGLVALVLRDQQAEQRRGPAAEHRKMLGRASKASAKLGDILTQLDDVTLRHAASKVASQMRDGYLADFAAEPLLRQLQAVHGAPTALRLFSDALGRGADAIGATSRGRPARSPALTRGLEDLREIWRRHGGDDPTQGRIEGRFGALAASLFAGPPCTFGEEAVRHAVAEMLPSPSGHRRPAPDEANGFLETPRSVLIIGVDTDLGAALATHYKEAGVETLTIAWPARDGGEAAEVDAQLLAGLDDQAIETVIVAPRDPKKGKGLMSSPSVLYAALASEPHRALREVLARGSARLPKRVVVIAPLVPLLASCSDDPMATLRGARAAQYTLVREIAQAVAPKGVIATLIMPGRSTDPSSPPSQMSSLAMQAQALATTIAGLTPNHAGEKVDIHGSRLPY